VIDRREFVGTLAGAAVGLAWPVGVTWKTAKRIERIGIQLYTVRGLMQKDFDATLAHVAEIGYREVEFAGYYGRTPAQVRDILKQLGLTAPATHIPLESLSKEPDATLDMARQVGHEYVVCPWIPEEQRHTLDDWRRIADQLNAAGAAAQKAGLQLAYHNHNFEFAPVDGQTPYDLLLKATDPTLVKLELDLFWITFAGADPLAYFAQYPGRFPLVHVKDMRTKPTPDATAEQVMADVGKGSIDWKGIFGHEAQAGIQHFFVEHDSPPEPLDDIRASFTYLKQLTF